VKPHPGLLAALGVALVAAALGWLGLRDGGGDDGAGQASAVRLDTTGGISLLAGGGSEGPPTPNAGAAGTIDAADIETRLFTDGSLRGAEFDGSWGRWVDGSLQPDFALRQRFDQLLTAVGEVNTNELRAFIASRAKRDTHREQAQAVLALWDAYLNLQQVRFAETIDLSRPSDWPRVLQAHQLARREHLGPAWAEAFYGEEEQHFRELIAERSQAPLPRPAGAPPDALNPNAELPASVLHQLRVATYGREAAERLREEDLAQIAWQTRLDNARDTVHRLRHAPELSELQRDQAVEQWLAQNFSASERLRVRALLNLP
jgi:lipase chaperone LimK